MFEESKSYKPFNYPWAYDACVQQVQMRWIPEEVNLASDLDDFHNKLTEKEQEFIRHIFRFFTQADSDVAGGYVNNYLPKFKAHDIRMMLLEFAAAEVNHMRSYSLLLDTLGMPEKEYFNFNNYAQMREKHDYMVDKQYLKSISYSEKEAIALDLACFSLFGEGLQLFSSFIMLLNFSRQGLMQKMGTIVHWSIKDEDHHVKSMIRLLKAFVDDHPEAWSDKVKLAIQGICESMVELEDKFIDLVFDEGDCRNLNREDVKMYVRYTADVRLKSVGLEPKFNVPKNPLKWVEEFLQLPEHTNFFEREVTEYTQGTLKGEWSDYVDSDLFDETSILKKNF